MKPILFAICNLFLILQGFSQVNWFPTGAKWHYEFGSMLGGGLTTLEVLNEDTLIGSHIWKTLLSTTITSPSPGIDTSVELFYVFEENQVVYGYDPLVGGTILYDFTANVGDTLEMHFGGLSPFPFVVDSIGTTEFNNHPLTFQDIRFPSLFDSTEMGEIRVIEGIGPMYTHFFHTRSVIQPTDAPTYYLRCYEDENLGLINLSYNQVDCDFIQGITSTDEATRGESYIYPNPSKDFVTLHTEIPNIEKLLIIDIMGNIHQVHSITQQGPFQVDIGELDNGLYFVVGQNKNVEVLYTGKIVKIGS